MGPLGVPELAIILVIIVIIFGVGKLPEIGGALGKGIREFKTEATDEEKEQKRIEEGASKGASTLTTSSKDGQDVVTTTASRERREIRADEI